MDATDPVLERKDTVEGAVQPGVGQWWTIPDDGSVPVMCRESDPLPAEWQGAGEAAVRAFREAATRSGRPLLSAYVGGSVARGEALPGLSTFHAWAYFAPGTSGDSDRDGGAALLLETVAAQEAAVRAAARAGDCTHAIELTAFPVDDPAILALFSPPAEGGGGQPGTGAMGAEEVEGGLPRGVEVASSAVLLAGRPMRDRLP
ncbi:hypothetical protein T484DRAFT_1796300, partial [Baffinella frigidus]